MHLEKMCGEWLLKGSSSTYVTVVIIDRGKKNGRHNWDEQG